MIMIFVGLIFKFYFKFFELISTLEWKEIRQSQSGHFSTGSFKIWFSSKISTSTKSNILIRLTISPMGFDCVFLAMAQIPIRIVGGLSSSQTSPSSGSHLGYKIFWHALGRFSKQRSNILRCSEKFILFHKIANF